MHMYKWSEYPSLLVMVGRGVGGSWFFYNLLALVLSMAHEGETRDLSEKGIVLTLSINASVS
jgi:hypothetical protein